MDAKLKDLWLKALRSGEYEQGTNYLRAEGRFCCLGVLCDVADKNGLLPEGVRLTTSLVSGNLKCDGLMGGIPPEKFGISDAVISKAWKYNDGSWGEPKRSFSEIADWLETALSEQEPS